MRLGARARTRAIILGMSSAPRHPPSFHDLLLRSDFGRLNPARVRELLDRAADPLMEDRSSPPAKEAPREPR